MRNKLSVEERRKRIAERKKAVYHTPKGNAYESNRRASLGVRYAKAKYNAPRRANRSPEAQQFSISIAEYIEIVSKPCYYCNASLAEEKGSSLDRIDNDLGYHIDNVVPCCKYCNKSRNKSMDSEEFKRQTKLNGRWN